MYIVKMKDTEYNATGYLTEFGEFGVEDEAAIFSSKNEVQYAINDFLSANDYSDTYTYKIIEK